MTQPGGTIPTIDVAEAAERLRAAGTGAGTPVLVDVREDDELVQAHVEGATHVPMSAFVERHAELPRDRPLFVMCASGNRSSAATAFLLRNGWTDVVNVEGGITAWQRAGLPVRRGAPESAGG
jgi:rhodanese-related sulfurtransferase